MNKLRTLIFAGAMVSTSMASAQTFSELFEGAHEDVNIAFTAGWVAKEWETKRGGKTLHEDLWGNTDELLHGVQFGVQLFDCFDWGLGYKTGLYYEWYRSTDDYLKRRGWDRFNEHDLYIPLHAMFRLPLTRKVSIIPYGGIGFNWAMYGNVKNGDYAGWNDYYYGDYGYGYHRYSESKSFNYNDHSPHHWNVQAEAGVMIRAYGFMCSFTYSRGLNHHQLYDDANSIQNKFSANISYVIPWGD